MIKLFFYLFILLLSKDTERKVNNFLLLDNNEILLFNDQNLIFKNIKDSRFSFICDIKNDKMTNKKLHILNNEDPYSVNSFSKLYFSILLQDTILIYDSLRRAFDKYYISPSGKYILFTESIIGKDSIPNYEYRNLTLYNPNSKSEIKLIENISFYNDLRVMDFYSDSSFIYTRDTMIEYYEKPFTEKCIFNLGKINSRLYFYDCVDNTSKEYILPDSSEIFNVIHYKDSQFFILYRQYDKFIIDLINKEKKIKNILETTDMITDVQLYTDNLLILQSCDSIKIGSNERYYKTIELFDIVTKERKTIFNLTNYPKEILDEDLISWDPSSTTNLNITIDDNLYLYWTNLWRLGGIFKYNLETNTTEFLLKKYFQYSKLLFINSSD